MPKPSQAKDQRPAVKLRQLRCSGNLTALEKKMWRAVLSADILTSLVISPGRIRTRGLLFRSQTPIRSHRERERTTPRNHVIFEVSLFAPDPPRATESPLCWNSVGQGHGPGRRADRSITPVGGCLPAAGRLKDYARLSHNTRHRYETADFQCRA